MYNATSSCNRIIAINGLKTPIQKTTLHCMSMMLDFLLRLTAARSLFLLQSVACLFIVIVVVIVDIVRLLQYALQYSHLNTAKPFNFHFILYSVSLILNSLFLFCLFRTPRKCVFFRSLSLSLQCQFYF